MITYDEMKDAIRAMYNAEMIDRQEMQGKYARLAEVSRSADYCDQAMAIRAQIKQLQVELDSIRHNAFEDFAESEGITL